MSSQPEPPFEMPKAPWPIRPLDKFFSWITDKQIAASESSVKDPRRFHRVQRWTIVRMVIVGASVGAIVFSSHIPWWGLLGWFVTVWFASQGASASMMKGRAYMNGWLEGRSAMIGSLKEAGDRGLDLHEWVQGEFERDTMVLMHAYRVELGDKDDGETA